MLSYTCKYESENIDSCKKLANVYQQTQVYVREIGTCRRVNRSMLSYKLKYKSVSVDSSIEKIIVYQL